MSPRRSRTRQADETRSTILDVALEKFAANGYAGTSMRDLASASGVSQALLHHHFGTKENLYRMARERAYEKYLQRRRPLVGEPPHTLACVEASLRAMLRRLREEPTALRFHMWSMLEGEEGLADGEHDLMQRVAGEIRHVQQAGLIRSDFDSHLLMLVTTAIGAWWAQNRLRVRARFYPQLSEEEFDERYLSMATELLLWGAANGELEESK